MKEIRDCKGRITCKVDDKTGEVEAKYKDCVTNFFVPVGSTFIVKRKDTITKVTRNAEDFESKSQYL